MSELVNNQQYLGTPCEPAYGQRDGKPQASLAMLIVEGPCKGMKVPYTVKKWDDKSLRYAIRDLKAAGWQGRSIRTFVKDITAANAAGHTVQFTARLAEYNGDSWWTVGSIGYSAPVLDSSTPDLDSDVDSWIADASGDGHGGGGSHPNAPSAYPYPNAPGSRDDIPFSPIPRRI